MLSFAHLCESSSGNQLFWFPKRYNDDHVEGGQKCWDVTKDCN